MKKIIALIIAATCICTAEVFAQGRGCPPCRPCPPPPPPGRCCGGWGYGWNCDRGLGNAAAITSIVANGISILGNLTYPRTVVTQPLYTAPVVVPQQTYVTPTPVIVQPGGPLPPGMIVGGGCPAIRYSGGCICY